MHGCAPRPTSVSLQCLALQHGQFTQYLRLVRQPDREGKQAFPAPLIKIHRIQTRGTMIAGHEQETMKLCRTLDSKAQRILARTVGGHEHVGTIVFRCDAVMAMAIHGTPPHAMSAGADAA
ncbi:hypothetical protein CNECB9_1450001 [Cupriavidus necator]|uniref:Uncharacterized protein n=1 Tax=Cupriavidus necator TaxID=106590 RepID=A0A1K0J4I5_CUPNE|nr:hypothetical protein CNECB9_1450001 [Cupriavidus necator]